MARRPDWTRLKADAGERLGQLRDRLRSGLGPARDRIGVWARRDPVVQAVRRPGPPERWGAGAAAAVLAALVAFLLLFDWNWARGPIARWASAAYGRDIRIDGDLDVDLFSLSPKATVDGLKIGGPDWASERDTADIGRLEIAVRLPALLRGDLELPLVRATRAEVVLIHDEDGRKSWSLSPDRPSARPTRLPPIARLIIRDGRMILEDRSRDLVLDAAVEAREYGRGEAGSGFTLDGEGTLRGNALSLTLRGGPFVNIRRDRPYGFTARLAGAGTVLNADGEVIRPFDFGRLAARLTLSGGDLADLYRITGITTPNTPPYEVSGDLTRNGDAWRFTDFAGTVGDSDLAGDVLVDKDGDRRRVEADLVSRSLDLDDLFAVIGGPPGVGGGETASPEQRAMAANLRGRGRLLPDAPLYAERLRAMDGRLDFRAASVKRNTLQVTAVRLGAALEGGVLTIDPLSFNFARGGLSGAARIDARNATPQSRIDLRLTGFPLETIIPARGGAPTVSGAVAGRVRLEGPGASIHQFASNAGGDISLVVPRGEIREAFAELLGVHVGRGLLLLFSDDQSMTPIRCGVAHFNVRGGVATARTLVIDTDVVLAKGSGTVNLGTERMNLRLDGESKRPRLLRLWAPILVSGPIRSPDIGVEGEAVAAQAGIVGALGALVAPLAAALGLIDPGLVEDANCAALTAGNG